MARRCQAIQVPEGSRGETGEPRAPLAPWGSGPRLLMSDEEPTKPTPLAHLIMPFAFPGPFHTWGGEWRTGRDQTTLPQKAMIVGSCPLRLFTSP